MISSKKIKALLFISILMLASACTQKSVILKVPEGIQYKIMEANSSVCAYKGRVSVIYENGKEDVRFKGFLSKDCNDDFKLKILGLFNTVAYDVSYVDGVVEAYEKGEDVSLEMAYFMHSKGLDNMVSLIRYPHVKIDNSFSVKAVADEYILTKGDVVAAAGEDLLLRRISAGNEKFYYGYTDGVLTSLIYENEGSRVEIKLR